MKQKNIDKLKKEIRAIGTEDGWGYQVIEADMDDFLLWLEKRIKEIDK